MKIHKIFNRAQSAKVLRVAAYCRAFSHVSSNEGETLDEAKALDEQEKLISSQASFYTQIINSIQGWKFSGVYADYEISESQDTQGVEGRPGFLRMIQDCENGLIDVIICKSISSFAINKANKAVNTVNTMDSLTCIRKLKSLGIRLIFEDEGIDTADSKSEMLITVFATLAQEEIRSSLSNRWCESIWNESRHGILIPTYGYRKNAAGTNYEIIPEEAETVRYIFSKYEHGLSVRQIINKLFIRGVMPPYSKESAIGAKTTTRAKTTIGATIDSNIGTNPMSPTNPTPPALALWDKSSIYHIIQNERYLGDLICQRTYWHQFLPAGYMNTLKNHHEAIITRKQFNRCNVIFDLKKKTTHSSYPFGDFLRCPYCGTVLYHRWLPIQDWDGHYLCEGERACREFAILAIPLKKAILGAWNDLTFSSQSLHILCGGQAGETGEDGETGETGEDEQTREKAGQALIRAKEQYPSFDTVEYWWIDEYMERITLGRHLHTASDVAKYGPEIDDRTVTIHWKCGLKTTVSSGVTKNHHDPRYKAKLWDKFLLRYPDKYPNLTEEVQRRRIQNKLPESMRRHYSNDINSTHGGSHFHSDVRDITIFLSDIENFVDVSENSDDEDDDSDDEDDDSSDEDDSDDEDDSSNNKNLINSKGAKNYDQPKQSKQPSKTHKSCTGSNIGSGNIRNKIGGRSSSHSSSQRCNISSCSNSQGSSLINGRNNRNTCCGGCIGIWRRLWALWTLWWCSWKKRWRR